MSEKAPRVNLPSIGTVKRALYADWALRVKQRDGWKCLLCGCTENLTAHHWFCSDHHAHAARYCVDNGGTLCYACHIRSVHTRADYVTVMKVYDRLLSNIVQPNMKVIAELVKVELTIPLLRSMWDEMRKRRIELGKDGKFIELRGKKIFLNVLGNRPIAVVGNVIRSELGDFDVLVVTPSGGGFYRYTVKEFVQ